MAKRLEVAQKALASAATSAKTKVSEAVSTLDDLGGERLQELMRAVSDEFGALERAQVRAAREFAEAQADATKKQLKGLSER